MFLKKLSILLAFLVLVGILPSPIFADDWTQEAHDASRTGYTPDVPSEPWSLLWTFNGPDSSGGSTCPNNDPQQGHCYDVGTSSTSKTWEGRTVTGGSFVYVPALTRGVYALRKTNGTIAWTFSDNTSFTSTPAYDPSSGSLLVGATNGKVYKINASTGTLSASYNAGSAINKAVMIVGNFVYAVGDNGVLHKINISNMTAAWTYQAGSAVAIAPAYSATRDIIIYSTMDLNVHAVNNSSGSVKWKVKPSALTGGTYTKFEFWPVVSDVNGVVLVRMNVGGSINGIVFGGPGVGGTYPTSNSAIKSFLASNAQYKNLFALNLDTGAEQFQTAVGPAGVEAQNNGAKVLVAPPVPVVKRIDAATEVAYTSFRNGESAKYNDGRGDSHIGEMVLNNTAVSGYSAGDVRFVDTRIASSGSMTWITDEQTPLTMAGSTFFYAHWGTSEAHTITDRSPSKGSSVTNQISTVKNPFTIRRFTACGTKNAATHYTTCGLTLYQDGKYWPGPGFWVYWNTMDPPTPIAGAYSEGLTPRYTYEADGLIIIQGNGGELFVLKHSGTPTQPTATPVVTTAPSNTPTKTPTSAPSFTPSITPSVTPVVCTGDIDGDGSVGLLDYSVLVQNFLRVPLTNPKADLNNDGRCDLLDYSVLVTHFLKPCSAN